MRRVLAAISLVVVTLGAVAATTRADVAPARRSAAINGFEMHYQVLGDGPPLVLLHYFGGCGDVLQPFFAGLSKRHRLIVPDLEGHGRSTDRPGEFTHRQAAHDVFALLDHLGIQRVAAVGTSSGGMTLLHMATQQPARIDAMTLVGAAPYFPPQARALMERVPAGLTAAERSDWARCSTRGDAQTDAILARFHRMKDSVDDMNFTAPLLATITARTLVVYGDRDEYFPVELALELYRAIPRAALWIVPNGDHLPIFGRLAMPFQAEVSRFLDAGAADR